MASTQAIEKFKEVYIRFQSNFPSRFNSDKEILDLFSQLLTKLQLFEGEFLKSLAEIDLYELMNEIREYNEYYDNIKFDSESDYHVFRDRLTNIDIKVNNLIPTVFEKIRLDLHSLYTQLGDFRAEFMRERERQKMISDDERKHLLAIANDQSKDLQKKIKDLGDTLTSDLRNSTAQAKQIEELNIKLRSEWEDFREKYKNIFATGEIYRQGDNFRINSENYFRLSKAWRIYILFVLLGIISVSIWFLFACWDAIQCIIKYQNLKDQYFTVLFYSSVISKILIKAFILTILIYILKFCINNYNALMHNSTISAHKHSSLFAALRIFEFIQDKDLQEKFLATASREIFTQHKTGYLRKEGNELSIPFIKKLMRLFKNDSK